MKKFFDKDETLFAVLWIIAYVVCFSIADFVSDKIGLPKVITVAVGLVMTVVLLIFMIKNKLAAHFGLCGFKGNIVHFLFFLPLIAITSVNLWNGVAISLPTGELILNIACMCFVGFLEEMIFRGLLFKGMCKINVKLAILVSALTFGAGHAVNLLSGAEIFETVLQLVYATAVGFCYTAVFYAGKSLIPCILSHALYNSLGFFGITPENKTFILIVAIESVICVAYSLWLLRGKLPKTETAQKTTE